jgi:hypothetical protein
LGIGIADILALADATAVALSNYGRHVFVLKDGSVRAFDLAGHAKIARRSQGISIADRQFHQGALFPYREGFGVLFADVLHVWDSPSATPRTVEVLNPVAQRDIAPISAAAVPDRDEIVVLLDDELYTGSGRFIARMHLADATAAWLGQPRDLAYDDFRGAAVQPYPHPASDHLFPEITDLVALSPNSVCVHAVGKPGGQARYGMAYSVLAEVDEDWVSTPLATIEHGYGTFASDRRVLLLRYLHARARLGFYSLDGVLQDTLVLSPKRVLGRVRDFFMTCDLAGSLLWLADGYGEVTCCALAPGIVNVSHR